MKAYIAYHLPLSAVVLLSAVVWQIACSDRRQSPMAPEGVPVSAVQPAEDREGRQAARVTLPDPTAELDYIMGKFDAASHPDFVEIDRQYGSEAGMYLRREAYEAFVRMHEAARKEGIALHIRSATRSFWHQKRIWEAKWTGSRQVDGKDLSKTIDDPVARALKILEYSAMPGSSRHHWGTDMDLNELNNGHFEQGIGLKTYQWLQAHAADFGFCQPYSPKGKERPEGYNEEKWHWSYLPLSDSLTKTAREHLTDEMMKGFLGAETATRIGIVKKYVLGIGPGCR